eukprot:scaffold590_cov383-Prasinococcus_capsulatus_cf.AAC.10
MWLLPQHGPLLAPGCGCGAKRARERTPPEHPPAQVGTSLGRRRPVPLGCLAGTRDGTRGSTWAETTMPAKVARGGGRCGRICKPRRRDLPDRLQRPAPGPVPRRQRAPRPSPRRACAWAGREDCARVSGAVGYNQRAGSKQERASERGREMLRSMCRTARASCCGQLYIARGGHLHSGFESPWSRSRGGRAARAPFCAPFGGREAPHVADATSTRRGLRVPLTLPPRAAPRGAKLNFEAALRSCVALRCADALGWVQVAVRRQQPSAAAASAQPRPAPRVLRAWRGTIAAPAAGLGRCIRRRRLGGTLATLTRTCLPAPRRGCDVFDAYIHVVARSRGPP